MQISLTRGGADDDTIVENMFTMFFYELSRYDDKMEITRFGLPVYMPQGAPPQTHGECVRVNWWVRGGGERYVIRADGVPAGFLIILNGLSVLPAGITIELADFWIVPKYRGRGVGRDAARLAFDLHHGSWVVYQLPRNEPAKRFWHRVIDEYTGGHFAMLEDGAQQRFTT